MNFSKSVLILLGKYSKMDVASSNEPEAGQLRAAMATCGLTAEKTHTLCGDTAVYVPKWHGVALASEAGIVAQCERLADKAAAAAAIAWQRGRRSLRMAPGGEKPRPEGASPPGPSIRSGTRCRTAPRPSMRPWRGYI
jgi:hypothetical protein